MDWLILFRKVQIDITDSQMKGFSAKTNLATYALEPIYEHGSVAFGYLTFLNCFKAIGIYSIILLSLEDIFTLFYQLGPLF